MKRMIPFIAIAAAGLAVCGWLVVRNAVRTAGRTPPANADATVARKPVAADRWQEAIRLDERTDYESEAKLKRQTEETLRREELRQKPWERRN